ncbi:biotin--protein ligase 2 isoform X1 [Ziziphus jujuba]|uniref:Biotin--protein ligase 2 isoform X1 n=1 Tax=Ziziphus jujuba TaxID=326968 RepID=A0A6P3Z141_ZIZJJ|nr:biotin--protein ligase 2 isoform X1 [Ziziphus jujuba]
MLLRSSLEKASSFLHQRVREAIFSYKTNCNFRRRSAATSAMDSSSSSSSSSSPPCKLVLCGKSSAENEIAESLKNNNTLKLPDNDAVSVLLQSEWDKPLDDGDSFRIDSFMNSLSTNRFGRFLLWSPLLTSTHDVVSHNFGELPVGAVCVADVQYKGRGRSKNVWQSPKGCLLFSFTLQMEDGRVVPLVQYVVSLAVTEAIKDICDKNGLPYVDVKIKWPNDLYLNNLKVGGILCTSTYKSKKFNISAGIGLNVDNEKPTICLNGLLRELSVVAYQFEREDILASFFNKFEIFYDLFMDQGFQSLEELYYKTWLHSGQRVIVQEKNEDQVVENVVTVQGLTSSGYLLAIGDDNQMCELHPDGNRFFCAWAFMFSTGKRIYR